MTSIQTELYGKDIKVIQEAIDRVIKYVWINHIKDDYHRYYLLKEDTLKNALYFHIRNNLSDSFLEKNRIRIFTEYHYKNGIADLAIVQLNKNIGGVHLKDEVGNVLAIIEVKYKSASNALPFEKDVVKIKDYIETTPFDQTQYYLAFIHETDYENIDGDSWLTKAQQKWAKGRVTELSGYYLSDEMVWTFLSHNDMNQNLLLGNLRAKEIILDASQEFDIKKYSEELYNYCLNVIRNAIRVTPDLQCAVRHLMDWKLGKITRIPTPTSEPIPCKDEIGETYYVAKSTTSNNNAINIALTEELLEYGLQFRDNKISYETFKKIVDSITKNSIVLPSFFIHIWSPVEFPILDAKVWRTYKWNKGEVVSKHTKPNSWVHYEEYTTFFRELVMETGLDWRIVDKGLWSVSDAIVESI